MPGERRAHHGPLRMVWPDRDLPQPTVQAVSIAFFDEPLAAPVVHGCLGDAEPRGDLARREHAAPAQPLVPAREFVGATDEGDLLEIEWLRLPCAPSILVEDIGDLTIAMKVEKTIDLGDKLGLELADLGDRQRPFEHQGARGTARQAHMDGDHLRLDQGHIVDEQAHDALSLAGVDARVLPDPRQLLGEIKNASRASALSAAACCLLRRS